MVYVDVKYLKPRDLFLLRQAFIRAIDALESIESHPPAERPLKIEVVACQIETIRNYFHSLCDEAAKWKIEGVCVDDDVRATRVCPRCCEIFSLPCEEHMVEGDELHLDKARVEGKCKRFDLISVARHLLPELRGHERLGKGMENAKCIVM